MSVKVGNFSSASDAKKAAMEAAKAKAQQAQLGAGEQASAIVKWIPPAECSVRGRIVFDDSGSMVGQIENAKKGVVEYFRSSIPNQTACAVHCMNTTSWPTALRSDLPQLGAEFEEYYLKSGGTPFFNTLKKALEATPTATNVVAFTDGAPTDQLQAEESTEMQSIWGSNADTWIASADIIIQIAHAVGGSKCIPIDTVYFGVAEPYTQRQRDLLKYLSDKTGGFFIVFDPAKVDFRKAFKYLAPVNRLMLTSGSFRAALERGEVK